MRRVDVEIFESVSDIPGAEQWQLTKDELIAVFERRYNQAGKPADRLKAWLDDHKIYPIRAELPVRVWTLQHEGLISLISAALDWAEEANPPRSDLA